MNETVNIELTLEECQKVVDALSALPYNQVYELIPKIIQQTNDQQD